MDLTLLFILAILGFCIFMIFYSIRKQKERKKNNDTVSDKPTITLFDYELVVRTRAVQLLESLHIIWTTKKYDTFSSRIEFISQFYGKFIPASKVSLYQGHMAKVIADYKRLYYDRELSEEQADLLLSPSQEQMLLFFSDCAVRFYERYVAHKTAEMNGLKTANAKQKRVDEMMETGRLVTQFFERYDLPDTGHLDRIISQNPAHTRF